MKKSRLLRITALFFALMLLFTILSRAAYQAGTAVVTTGKPVSRVIEHRVECSGKIQENQELAVTTQPDQRITSIAVQEGQMVKKGDLLFEIDLEVLEEKILNQQQELEKQELQSSDTKSQQEVKQEQKANEQAQASEQYSLSVGKANTVLERSRQALSDAKKALADFDQNSSQTQQADDTVEQALQQDCDKKTEAYIQAENDLSNLQREIEAAEADEQPVDADDSGTEILESEESGQELQEVLTQNNNLAELEAAKENAEQALEEKKAAEGALAQYQAEQSAAAASAESQSRQQLAANVEAAQSAYEDAEIAANEAAVTSNRAVQTANLPEAEDSSQRLNEITYEQMQLSLDKLEKLKQDQGRVTAAEDGLITTILVQPGEKTTDTAALRMTNLSKGYRFSGELNKEQEKYIGTGDLVTLTGSNQKEYTDLAVEAVTVDETDETIYHITVPIPDDTLALGASATLTFAKKSNTYATCIPLSALHLDEKNQPYVLVVDESESIMGAEKKARKVNVTILEQNESYAALAEGAVTTSQELIFHSSKAVDDGSRVRIQKGSA